MLVSGNSGSAHLRRVCTSSAAMHLGPAAVSSPRQRLNILLEHLDTGTSGHGYSAEEKSCRGGGDLEHKRESMALYLAKGRLCDPSARDR